MRLPTGDSGLFNGIWALFAFPGAAATKQVQKISRAVSNVSDSRFSGSLSAHERGPYEITNPAAKHCPLFCISISAF